MSIIHAIGCLKMEFESIVLRWGDAMNSDKKSLINRRKFLSLGAYATGTWVLASSVTRAIASTCGLTPAQTAGPFYPGEAQFKPDNDLTQLPGHTSRAKGQIIYVSGAVLDAACKPIAGATVEIWQACESGKYNNASDPNPAAIDPDFKYWGEAMSDSKGEYFFKTIIPGAYPADVGWIRPPHIHFKVSKLGYHELITQMYFEGNAYNNDDLILKAVPEAERDRVIVKFNPSPEVGADLSGRFDITLQSVK